MKPVNLFFLSLTALCLLLSQMARSEEVERADRVLFNENFEDGDPKGWDLMGRGRAKVTTYAGNHSLNLSKKRSIRTESDSLTSRCSKSFRLAQRQSLLGFNLAVKRRRRRKRRRSRAKN